MIHLSKLHWNILRNLRSLAWISSSDIFFFFLSLVWALGWSFVGPGRKKKTKTKTKIKLLKFLLLGSFSSQLSCWQTITKSLKCRKTVEHLQTALTNQSKKWYPLLLIIKFKSLSFIQNQNKIWNLLEFPLL